VTVKELIENIFAMRLRVYTSPSDRNRYIRSDEFDQTIYYPALSLARELNDQQLKDIQENGT
jgi:hypothetical protein